MARICIFGDSIAWGHNDCADGGWAELLRIDLLNSHDDMSVYNCSISGDTTKEVLVRFDTEYTARHPEIVIFAIGINDSAFYGGDSTKNRVDPQTFRKNLAELYVKAKDSTIVFLGLTPIDNSKVMPLPWRPELSFSDECAKDYDTSIAQFCAEKNIAFIAIHQALTLEDLDDGLHPNAAGHRKMYDVIKNALKKQNLI